MHLLYRALRVNLRALIELVVLHLHLCEELRVSGARPCTELYQSSTKSSARALHEALYKALPETLPEALYKAIYKALPKALAETLV